MQDRKKEKKGKAYLLLRAITDWVKFYFGTGQEKQWAEQ